MPPNDSCATADARSTIATHWQRCSGLRALPSRRRRKVFVEYVMLAGGERSPPARAANSPRLLDPSQYKVNLIPYNPTGSYRGSSPEQIERFRAVLAEQRVTATVRLTRGRDIAAACGQLAAAAGPAVEAARSPQYG